MPSDSANANEHESFSGVAGAEGGIGLTVAVLSGRGEALTPRRRRRSGRDRSRGRTRIRRASRPDRPRSSRQAPPGPSRAGPEPSDPPARAPAADDREGEVGRVPAGGTDRAGERANPRAAVGFVIARFFGS